MAKFLNKKQQVLDIKLTPYGKHLLAAGNLKPEYYAFYDDNILYDGAYAGLPEGQNDIIKRIKEDTQYLEGLVKFTDADDEVNTSTSGGDAVLAKDSHGAVHQIRADTPYYEIDLTASLNQPTKTFLKYEIGDAYLEGDTQKAPAWKAVALNGKISGSTQKDTLNNIDIPQIDVTVKYNLRVKPSPAVYDNLFNSDIRKLASQTGTFSDGNIIVLESDDLMLYVEEMNTALLTENFDIEVFLVNTGSIPKTHVNGTATDEFVRKLFTKESGRLVNGYYKPNLMSTNSTIPVADYTTESVRYFFDVAVDRSADAQTACKAAEIYNKDSYYIDLDLECDQIETDEGMQFDIYGQVTEPEICQ